MGDRGKKISGMSQRAQRSYLNKWTMQATCADMTTNK
jgi:hypothetical protein